MPGRVPKSDWKMTRIRLPMDFPAPNTIISANRNAADGSEMSKNVFLLTSNAMFNGLEILNEIVRPNAAGFNDHE